MIIVANIGYLPGIVLKELSAGRKCEIIGGVCLSIDNHEDYDRKKDKLVGKFGEVVARKSNGVVLIATRSPPPWAEKKIDEVIWDCEEMLRWDVPKEQR
ncbi:MAG: hypothetical protein WCX79_00210 [Candidatus Paceibacterota bacterium]|jgi:hypothetical protein